MYTYINICTYVYTLPAHSWNLRLVQGNEVVLIVNFMRIWYAWYCKESWTCSLFLFAYSLLRYWVLRTAVHYSPHLLFITHDLLFFTGHSDEQVCWRV